MAGQFCEPLFPTQQPIKTSTTQQGALNYAKSSRQRPRFWARFGNSKRKPCSFALRHFQQIIDLAIRGASTKQRLKARFRKTCEREREREMGAWSKTQKPFLFGSKEKMQRLRSKKTQLMDVPQNSKLPLYGGAPATKTTPLSVGSFVSDFMAGFRMPRRSQSSVATLSTLNRGTSELNSF